MHKAVCILIMLFSLTACQHDKTSKQKNALQLATATLRSTPTQLYYSGTISPLQVDNVVSPSDGSIKKILFKYGEKVKPGQLLMIINAAKLQEDYHTAFTNYLKAKEDYLNSISNFQGTLELKKAQIISQQEYFTEKSQYDNTVLAYLNAKTSLEEILKKLPGTNIQLEKLSISDIPAITKILKMQSDNLNILAKSDGVVLYPTKDANASGDSGSADTQKNLVEGSPVKQGQVLIALGNLSGITTTVQVSELIINRLKPGQKVMITSEALPGIILRGVVKTVGAQAQTAMDGGLATFPITVMVPQLTAEQIQLIRVGMTTKVQISIENPAQLMVPLAAVNQTNGQNTVTIYDPKTKQKHDVVVTTGQTTLDSVEIVSGLKPGDQVIIP